MIIPAFINTVLKIQCFPSHYKFRSYKIAEKGCVTMITFLADCFNSNDKR